MKKVLITIIILIICGGVYYLFLNTEKKEIRCEEGFRFVPSTQKCESIETSKEKSIDFSKVTMLIPDTQTTIQLQQVGNTTKYTSKVEDPQDASLMQFVSLDSKDAVTYSEELIIAPFSLETGGTGYFTYIGLFDVNTNKLVSSGYIGDRIEISTLGVVNEKIKINFKTRLDSESFAQEPSIPAEVVFTVLKNKMIEIIRLQNANYSDIEIKSPALPLVINGEVEIKGAIPGSWYFEGSAQYKIMDKDNKEIALGSISALSDWMTTQRVPFVLDLSSENINYSGKAMIIIQSENVQGGEEGEKLVKKMFIPAEFK